MFRQATSPQLDESHLCTVRLDRLQFRARAYVLKLLLLSGFVRMRGHSVRAQTSVTTYRRVDTFLNQRTGTKVFLQREPACPWLWPLKATVVAEDRRGLCSVEAERIFSAFKPARLLLVELALDFTLPGGIDRAFVLRYGLFGKSRPIGGRLYKNLRYGSRFSGAITRAYEKPQTKAYRVEVQLQRTWLRAWGIQQLGDLAKLPALIVPSRVRFVRIDWDALAKYLSRKEIAADPIVREAQTRGSLHSALEYLRRDVGVANVHRFLRLLPINEEIRLALQMWARKWAEDGPLDERRT